MLVVHACLGSPPDPIFTPTGSTGGIETLQCPDGGEFNLRRTAPSGFWGFYTVVRDPGGGGSPYDIIATILAI